MAAAWRASHRRGGVSLSICSLQPRCPSSARRLSPRGPRCIANDGLLNHTTWETNTFNPVSVFFHLSSSLLPFVLPEQTLCVSISIKLQLTRSLLRSAPFLPSTSPRRGAARPFVPPSEAAPSIMAEAYLWEELVRRCELNPLIDFWTWHSERAEM